MTSRRGKVSRYLWPGFGENSRVLKWIFERCDLPAASLEKAHRTPIGLLPEQNAVDRAGLPVSDHDMAELLRIDKPGWLAEVTAIRAHYAQFADRLPQALQQELTNLESRLQK